jgi:hypothetical protein
MAAFKNMAQAVQACTACDSCCMPQQSTVMVLLKLYCSEARRCCCCCLQVDNKSTTEVPAVEFYLHPKLQLTASTMWGKRDKSFNTTRIHQR